MRGFRPGDMVVVRPAEEILATLDRSGSLDGLPFMPEMLQFTGKRFSVTNHIVKVCDTIGTDNSREMRDAVFLEDLRCDGCDHGGCQAQCRIIWKEAWLSKAHAQSGNVEQARERLMPTTQPRPDIYSCQATRMTEATTRRLRTWDIRQYLREVYWGNINLRTFFVVGFRAVVRHVSPRLRLMEWVPQWIFPHWHGGELGYHDKGERLNLQPGELVEVRSRDEIARTLNRQGKNRGLFFSWPEQLPLVGRQFRVRGRVERIIDEKTGRMRYMKHDCVLLEGCVCDGTLSAGRWFCARNIFPYWRESWLKRVGEKSV